MPNFVGVGVEVWPGGNQLFIFIGIDHWKKEKRFHYVANKFIKY